MESRRSCRHRVAHLSASCLGVLPELLIERGQPVELTVLPVGLSGGPGAVWAPCGAYSR